MVSTSLAVTGAWANGLTLAGVLAGFDSTERRDEEGWSNPFSNIYGTGDGRHLMLALAVPKQEFPRLTQALGHPEWAADPRFADIRTALKYRHALRALIQSGFAAMTIDQADAALKANDITFSIVARVADVVTDPQLLANGLVVGTDSTEPGYDRTLASPFRIHDEAQRTPSRAPTIGAAQSRGVARAWSRRRRDRRVGRVRRRWGCALILAVGTSDTSNCHQRTGNRRCDCPVGAFARACIAGRCACRPCCRAKSRPKTGSLSWFGPRPVIQNFPGR